jgi:predicted nucleic acid-binding protein
LRYVLDCSVAIKWFVPEELSDKALQLLHEVEAGRVSLVAPESIVAEFGYVLRKAVLNDQMSAERCQAIIEDFTDVPLEWVSLRAFAPQAMRLTASHMANFYDALYIALAINEDLRVLTADAPMTRAFAKLDRTLRLSDFRP